MGAIATFKRLPIPRTSVTRTNPTYFAIFKFKLIGSVRWTGVKIVLSGNIDVKHHGVYVEEISRCLLLQQT